MEVMLDDIPVMYVLSQSGPEGAKQAFNVLESRFKSLRGRRFYGTFYEGEYRACVAIQPEDNPEGLGLEASTIPGGKYVREKLMNWTRRIPEIGKIFMEMGEEHSYDPDRPSIEYYRSQVELHLLLPVK
jgi:hypothetical protein